MLHLSFYCLYLLLLSSCSTQRFDRFRPDDRGASFGDGGPGYCGPDEATCRNGECVKRTSICDGEFDCRDRSDEMNCGTQRPCEPNEFLCANRRCVQKMWVCDNEDDCGDNSDERDCGTRAPGELCAPSEFKCGRGDQCIPKSYQCDSQNDCQDGTDEIGCSEPVVVEPPESEKTVCEGDTLVLTCRAIGVPVPFINWRLNWGPVCDPPRCTQTSVDGYGVLTIQNVGNLDQGAYSCEAINTRKRILAVPDAIVSVKRCGDNGGGEKDTLNNCNPDGTAVVLPGNRCQCKHYATGPYCEKCSDYCFNLAQRNPHGCIRCFCMGVTRQCDSSGYSRSQERLTFRGDSQGVTISDLNEQKKDPYPQFDYEVVSNTITVLRPQLGGILYWRLPSTFLGNKLTSYGGKLKFSIQYSGYPSPVEEPLVVLKGNEITLVHRNRNRLTLVPDRLNPIEVDIYETSFTREDGQQATHEHFLMMLAGLETFLIRQTHSQSQTSSSLGEVSLDIAVPDYTGQDRADAVEKCACPDGYVGLSCEACAPGYSRTQGGLYLGTCERSNGGHHDNGFTTRPTRRPPTPGPDDYPCHPDGSLSDRPDPRTGQCRCKEHVTGDRCDQCKPHSFSLSRENPHGCVTCFCSAVTRDCQSSQLYRQEQSINDFRDWVVPVRTGEIVDYARLRTPAVATSDGRGLYFDSFHEFSNGRTLYLEIPHTLLGNKIASYGGKLRIRFTYSADGDIDDQNPCAVIRGNDISLFHTTQQPTQPGQDNVISIPIYENRWQREDRRPSTREHFLMTLADLDTLLIKVNWKQNMRSFTLNEVSVDDASHVPSHFGLATAVEECRCPPGYVGSSCEDCASGYTRTGGGLYLGLCELCFCNGHSSECELHGECKNCQHNTVGARCDRCAPGYYGDARRGTPYDCQSSSGFPGRPDFGPRRGPNDEQNENNVEHGGDEAEEQHPTTPEYDPHKSRVEYQGGIEETEAPDHQTEQFESDTSPQPQQETTTHDPDVEQRGDLPDNVDKNGQETHEVETTTEMVTTTIAEHENGDAATTSIATVDGDHLSNEIGTDSTDKTEHVGCEDCKCYSHSPRGCDDQCKCVECEDNTEGDQCEKCKNGFYGDATIGSPFDCHECPCSGAESCFQDTDGYVTCQGCPEGYSGRICADCSPGYKKDEENPSICKLIENTKLLKRRRLRKQRKILLKRRLRNI